MRFIAPERLYFLAALLPAVLAVVYAARRRRREMRLLFADRETAAAAARVSPGGRLARILLVLLALVLAVVAAARPYWRTHRIITAGTGRDVAVVFDVSKSMLAKDLHPSRLEHAKFVLRQLAKKLSGDRLSLIAFAGDAYLACPLTPDRAVFDEYVSELSPELIQRGGTDLEKGLREALKSLSGAPGTQAVVVLTDGDELTGSSSRVVSELERRRIPLIVIGLGDPERPTELPDENGTLRRDREGRLITSKLNEPALKKLAAATGGAYVRTSVADTGIDAAAARIDRLAPARHGETAKELPEERFDLFLALAAAALLLALIVPERPWRSAAAVLAVVALLPWRAGAAENPPATQEPKIDQIRTAAELHNLGLERHRAGDLPGAEKCFEAVLRHPDRDERARAKAYFNLGAMEHENARRMLREARETVQKQELDPALKKLDAAAKTLGAARELYVQALGGGGAAALNDAAADNLRLHEADLKRLAELKKSIEELKKQLEKARQSAKNARRQNQKQQRQEQKQQSGQQDQQQDEQQQSGQQNQPQQDKQQQSGQQNQPQQDKQQQSGQQNQKQDKQQSGQQNRQQGQPQERRDAARQAAEESEKLRDQAEKLGQRELEERARRAAADLRRAENSPDAQTARPHLDRAVKELDGRDGKEQKKSDAEKKPPEDKKADGKDGEKSEKQEERRQAEAPVRPQDPKPAETGSDQLLRMLDDEERELRRELRRRAGRPEVTRDW